MVMEYKKKSQAYDTILSELNDNLEGLVDRLKDDIQKQNKILNPITSEMPQSCGSMEKNAFTGNVQDEKLSAQDRKDIREAKFGISQIKEELLNNQIDFPEASSIVPNEGQTSGGKGTEEGFIALPEMPPGEPEWFSEIEAGLGDLIGTPKMGRKYLDYEGAQTYLEQGVAVFRKAKNRVIKNDKEVIVLLDQSGSMGSYATDDVSFLELLSQFIPELAKKYSGQFWVCSDCNMRDYENDPYSVPNEEIPLKEVTNRLIYKGGGGTAFSGAFRKLGDIERTKQKDNPDYEMCLVFFSDMLISAYEFKEYKQYGPTKQIWVTSKGQRKSLERDAGWIRDDENIKEVYIDMVKT